jgi:membrane protein YqaA with SNARE-associated domain
MGQDMHRENSTSLFEYFDKPSNVLEPVDYCSNQPLSKLVVSRLFYVARAHKTDEWRPVDRMVEKTIIKRIESGSECVVATFFGIDEYSHLYSPFHEKTIEAYLNIDRAIGNIASVLKRKGLYEKTVIAIVSDHGLTDTSVHIPLVDIVKEQGFDPHYYPKLHRKRHDSAVMESGNSMAALYFKRSEQWGENWHYDEMRQSPKICALIDRLLETPGVSFVGARLKEGGVTIAGRNGLLRAAQQNGIFNVSIEGDNPLGNHPTGQCTIDELLSETYHDTYPDAVNQINMLFTSERSGDLVISSEPTYDLRWQHEDPEHHGSHGSLHREHMHVPLAFSVPFATEHVRTTDVVPTILALTNKVATKRFDGNVLELTNGHRPLVTKISEPEEEIEGKKKGAGGLGSILVTIGIMLTGVIIASIFREDIHAYGMNIMENYGKEYVDLVLLLVTAISSTPLALPIWTYSLAGIALGYNIYRLAFVMGVGSALGSLVTYFMGRFFGQTEWVKKRFPKVVKHPWTHGKSRFYTTLVLFLGTASPIPCDVLYVACGVKKYPSILFLITMTAARFVRYVYLGYFFKYSYDIPWFS